MIPTRVPPVPRPWLIVGIILLVLYVYWPLQGYDFINFDDNQYVTENPHVIRGLNPESLKWAFTTTFASNWHPITWLSHMTDVELFGLNAGRHHMVNVLLHIANSVLLFVLLAAMTGSLTKSFVVAVLFAIHPLHVESVAWISERKDLLSTLFWFLSIGAYVLYVNDRRGRNYLLVLSFFVLGLMTKPMLVTLPFFLLLLDIWPLQRLAVDDKYGEVFSKAGLMRMAGLFREKIPLFLCSAVSSIITLVAQSQGGALKTVDEYSLGVRIANAVVGYGAYIVKTLWPAKLTAFYPHPGDSIPLFQVFGWGLVLFTITAFTVHLSKKSPYLFVGWAWFSGTLVPVIGLVQVGAQAVADRYTYVPVIGLFIILVWGVPEIVPRLRYRQSILVLGTLLMLSAMTFQTRTQIATWQNSVTLFEHALSVTDNNFVAHDNLAIALRSEGRMQEALTHAFLAWKIRPDATKRSFLLGKALMSQQMHEQAIEIFSFLSQKRP